VFNRTEIHPRQVQYEVVSDCEETKIMQYVVVGILGSFGDAEAAVRDLELAGIVGEQVKLITDIDQDVRTANIPGEPSTKPHKPHRRRFVRLFGATRTKRGGAVLIVRTTAEAPASGAAAILLDHGARTPGQKGGPVVQRMN
jgi:hypothetical protein